MYDLLRDSTAGQLLRWSSKGHLCQHAEDSPSFVLSLALNAAKPGPGKTASEEDLEKSDDKASDAALSGSPNSPSPDLQHGKIVVGWYSEDDPENPANWSGGKKAWVTVLLLVYTVSVYIGSSLYTSSEGGVMQQFHVGATPAAVGLAVYVIGYGAGAMVFSPLSEIPAVGRLVTYTTSFFIFVILCVPAALVDNYAGLIVLRLLLGFFGSPCLATAGASLGDMFSPAVLPYLIVSWTGGAAFGPALGPMIGGFAVQAENWRWSFWELLWFCGPVLVVLLLAFPETSSDAILHRRAARLRRLTGRTDLCTAAEIERSKMSRNEILFDALIKPWEINVLDPAVLFTTFYLGVVYSIFYSFFESFPFVYQDVYNFNLGQLGLGFLSALIGIAIACALFVAYLYFWAVPRFSKMEHIQPEEQLRPALVAGFCIPIGLFIFAWTSRSSVPWIASMIGVGLSMGGVQAIANSVLSYLPFTYPMYVGSLFAANSLMRSLAAAAAILYSRPMFIALGVDGGVSLLAGVTVLCLGGIWFLFYFGETLRKRSRFAVS